MLGTSRDGVPTPCITRATRASTGAMSVTTLTVSACAGVAIITASPAMAIKGLIRLRIVEMLVMPVSLRGKDRSPNNIKQADMRS